MSRSLASGPLVSGPLAPRSLVPTSKQPQSRAAAMGDWAKGFFMSKGLQPDVEFGQASVPGTQGVFNFITVSFGLPKGAAHRQAAVDFLTLVGSPKGQAAFNP